MSFTNSKNFFFIAKATAVSMSVCYSAGNSLLVCGLNRAANQKSKVNTARRREN